MLKGRQEFLTRMPTVTECLNITAKEIAQQEVVNSSVILRNLRNGSNLSRGSLEKDNQA